MSKQWLIYGGVGISISLASFAIGVLVVSAKRNMQKISVVSPAVQPSLSNARDRGNALQTYSDASGFSFQYPSSLTLTDETPKDNSYYSTVSLKDASGAKMTVTVRDTTVKTVDEWFATAGSGAARVSTKLGTLDAQQYQNNGKIITFAIDQGVLYLVESLKDGGFWEQAHAGLVSSFVFSNPMKTTSADVPASSDNSGDTVYETEEVVQ